MAKMGTCPCGFTVISPKDDSEVIRHISMHLSEDHPGTAMSNDEIRKKIVSL